MSRITTYADLRNHLSAYCDQVAETGEPLIIKRQGGAAVALVSLEDLAGVEETTRLLRSPKNALRLLESLLEVRQGGGVQFVPGGSGSGANFLMMERRAVFSTHALEDLEQWKRTDSEIAERLLHIVRETLRDPLSGMGRPEPLKQQLAGCLSRRLSQEHRVVYEVVGDEVRLIQAQYHY